MGLFAAGQVVVLPFPYSDLTARKFRPVLLLASAGNDDWIACRITSNPFADPRAVELTADSFVAGGLRHTSYARPTKLFTANESLITAQAETLSALDFSTVRDAVVAVLRAT